MKTLLAILALAAPLHMASAQSDIHNPAAQGLYKGSPYLTPWSQHWLTNGNALAAAKLLFADANATAYIRSQVALDPGLAPVANAAPMVEPVAPPPVVIVSPELQWATNLSAKTISVWHTNQSFAVAMPPPPAPAVASLIVANSGPDDLTHALPFAAYSLALGTNITSFIVPGQGALALDFIFDGTTYWLMDFGANATALTSVATANEGNPAGNQGKRPTGLGGKNNLPAVSSTGPAFAGATASYAALTGGGNQLIPVDTAESQPDRAEPGIDFISATNAFRVAVTGVYGVRLATVGTSSLGLTVISLQVNGVETRSYCKVFQNDDTLLLTDEINLNGGDIINFRIRPTGNGRLNDRASGNRAGATRISIIHRP